MQGIREAELEQSSMVLVSAATSLAPSMQSKALAPYIKALMQQIDDKMMRHGASAEDGSA
jgi:hypothetical protein